MWSDDINVSLTGSLICSKYFGTEISKNPQWWFYNKYFIRSRNNFSRSKAISKKKYSKNKQIVKPVSYSVVKFGIIGLTKYLATYWPESNVRCNAICPGGVENNQDSDFLKKFQKNSTWKISEGR